MKTVIIKKLIDSFPQLKESVNEILEDFSQIYLHLIFGDAFNPYLIDLLDDAKLNHNQLIKASELLEYMLQLDEEIQEVVVATVLERLSDDKTKLKIFSTYAGERTRRFIKDME